MVWFFQVCSSNNIKMIFKVSRLVLFEDWVLILNNVHIIYGAVATSSLFIFFFLYQDLAATEASASPMKGVSHRPILKIKFSLTLASKPTFAHTFLSTPRDVQPDKKKSSGRFSRFHKPGYIRAPPHGIHSNLAETHPWGPLSRCAASWVCLCPHYQSYNRISHAPPLSPIPTFPSSSG